jgi:Protein of unknown function (DUF3431)
MVTQSGSAVAQFNVWIIFVMLWDWRGCLRCLFISLLLLPILTQSGNTTTNSTGTTKVVVPAVYREWVNGGPPHWIWNNTFQEEYGYSTFLYQKLNASAPNYISTNRGCENGVYYQYIVDHYDDFPDLAFFVHAHPHEHNGNWLDLVKCARPNATFFSLNLKSFLCRESWNGIWARYGIWLEQCIRDTLRLAWGNISVAELNTRVPPNRPIKMCTYCCQQFLLSRAMVRRRPLSMWKELQYILSTQNVCHAGEPDYDNLYSFNASSRMRLGPEDPALGMGIGKYGGSPGRLTQAVTSEHLAHVIFGDKPVEV